MIPTAPLSPPHNGEGAGGGVALANILPMRKRSSTADDTECLTNTVEDFCVWIESLPAEETRTQAWGPREILAHLVHWHEQIYRAEQSDPIRKAIPGALRTVCRSEFRGSRQIPKIPYREVDREIPEREPAFVPPGPRTRSPQDRVFHQARIQALAIVGFNSCGGSARPEPFARA